MGFSPTEPTRGEAPPRKSIVRNEMKGYDTGEHPTILENNRLKCDSGYQRHRMCILIWFWWKINLVKKLRHLLVGVRTPDKKLRQVLVGVRGHVLKFRRLLVGVQTRVLKLRRLLVGVRARAWEIQRLLVEVRTPARVLERLPEDFGIHFMVQLEFPEITTD